MKSNRKIIMSAFTLLLAAISLAGCAKVAREPETTTAPETTTEEQTTEPTTEPTTQAETTKATSARGAETTRRGLPVLQILRQRLRNFRSILTR